MDVTTPEQPLPWSAMTEGSGGKGCGQDMAVAAAILLALAAAVVGGFLWLAG